MADKEIKVCPRCGSKAIFQILGTITGQLFRCPQCGYQGPFIVKANEEMIKKIKEDYEKNSS